MAAAVSAVSPEAQAAAVSGLLLPHTERILNLARRTVDEVSALLGKWLRRRKQAASSNSSTGGDGSGSTDHPMEPADLVAALSAALEESYWSKAVGGLCAAMGALTGSAVTDAAVAALPILLPLVRDLEHLNQTIASCLAGSSSSSSSSSSSVADGGRDFKQVSLGSMVVEPPHAPLLKVQTLLATTAARLALCGLVQGPDPSFEEAVAGPWIGKSLLFAAGPSNWATSATATAPLAAPPLPNGLGTPPGMKKSGKKSSKNKSGGGDDNSSAGSCEQPLNQQQQQQQQQQQ